MKKKKKIKKIFRKIKIIDIYKIKINIKLNYINNKKYKLNCLK